MGILKWLQKKGSVGSIVRTVIKQYKFLKKKNPELEDDEILEMIFENRYKAMRPKSSEKERHLFAMADSRTYESVRNLSMAILNIEMNVNSSNDNLYNNCSDIVDEEIQRLAPELNKPI